MSTRTGKSVWYPRTKVGLRLAYETSSTRAALAEELLARLFEVQPNSWAISFNDHRTPDTFSCEFSFDDVPLDPDIVRDLVLEIHLASAPDGVTDIAFGADTVAILGHVDEMVERRGQEGQVVRGEGRDQTALALDTKWPRNLRAPISGPLNQVIRNIITRDMPPGAEFSGPAFPMVSDFEVFWDEGGITNGMPNVSASDFLAGTAPRLDLKKALRRDTPSAFTESNLWDVIYTLALHAGVVLEVKFVDGAPAFVLRPPETLLAPGSEVVLLFGKNLEYLELKREMGRVSVPNVEVRCVIDGELVVATYPPSPVFTDYRAKKDKDGKLSASGTKQFLSYNVSGFRDFAALADLAKLLWHQAGRKETQVTFATRDLEGFEGSDLTKLRSGATMRLHVDPEDVRYMGNLSRARRENRLVKLGYAPQVAQEIAAKWDLVVERPRRYFLNEASMNWGNRSGIQITGMAVNLLGTVAGTSVS